MKSATHLFVLSLTGCVLVASLFSACTGVQGPLAGPGAGEGLPAPVQVGLASWYGQDFHGRPTASGELYDIYQPTAAHRTVPLGTQAVVTNMANGHTVRVRINDRGPYKRPRILDLSYAAAQQLDMLRAGVARVQVAFLGLAVPRAPFPALPVAASPVWHRVSRAFPKVFQTCGFAILYGYTYCGLITASATFGHTASPDNVTGWHIMALQ